MKKILVALLSVAMMIMPRTVIAQDKHWANEVLEELKETYNIEVKGDLNEPANPILQEQLFGLAGLEVTPQAGMIRFWAFTYFLEPLNIKVEDSDEENKLLKKYRDKCDYCRKANKIFSKAEKIGILKGRLTPEGLRLAPQEAITTAELAVLTMRYLEIKDGHKNYVSVSSCFM